MTVYPFNHHTPLFPPIITVCVCVFERVCVQEMFMLLFVLFPKEWFFYPPLRSQYTGTNAHAQAYVYNSLRRNSRRQNVQDQRVVMKTCRDPRHMSNSRCWRSSLLLLLVVLGTCLRRTAAQTGESWAHSSCAYYIAAAHLLCTWAASVVPLKYRLLLSFLCSWTSAFLRFSCSAVTLCSFPYLWTTSSLCFAFALSIVVYQHTSGST